MFLLIYLLSFIFPSLAYAQGDLDPCTGGSTEFPCTVSTLQIGGVLADVINFIFVVAVILALGFLVYGGIKWLTSGGDKDGVASARGTIIAAIIGLIIIFLAYVILNFVLLFLTGRNISGINIPNLTGDTANITPVNYCTNKNTLGSPSLSECDQDPLCRTSTNSNGNTVCIPQ